MLTRRHFLTYTLLFLAGCTTTTLTNDANSSGDSSSSTERPKKLRLAISDIVGTEGLEAGFAPFRDALSNVLGIPVELVPVDSFLAAAPAMLANQVDIVFAGPSEYLVLNARAEATPLVAITRPDYFSVIIVSADSELTSLEQLKEKTVGMRSEGATAGHIGATKILQDAGLDFKTDYRTVMIGKAGLAALLDGSVDAVAQGNNNIAKMLKAVELEREDIRVIGEGELLPNDVFVARKNLSPEFMAEFREAVFDNQAELLAALTSTEANAKFSQSEFVSAEHSDYDEIRGMYVALGLDSLIQ